MEYLKEKKGNTVIIYFSGNLDINASSKMEKTINSSIENDPDSDLLLNFKDVEYMSSSGLRILVLTMKQLNKSKKKMKLCCMNSITKEILLVTDLTELFNIYDSEEEALKS